MRFAMRDKQTATPLVAGLLGLCLIAVPTIGSAQTTKTVEQGGSAGPVSETARVVGTNPSGMGTIDGIDLDLDHSLHLRSQSFEADDDRAESLVLQSNPSVAFVSDLGTDLVRVGFYGALPRRYGSAWPTDGPQRHDSIFHRVRDIHLTAAAAVSPLDWLHLGGSVRAVQAEYRSYRAADLAPIVAKQEGVDPETVPRRDPGNEGREYLDFNGRTLGWTAGATVTPGRLRIGAAFHAPVDLELQGSYKMYLPRNEYYADRYGGDVNRDATLETRWPARVDAGLAYEIRENVEVFGNVGWEAWSSVDAVAVDVEQPEDSDDFDRRERLELRDSFEVRAGGLFELENGLGVDATLGAETSPLPPGELTARVLDMPKVLAGLGVRWPVAEGVGLRTGYQHLHYFSKTTDPSDGESGTPGRYTHTVGMVETSVSIRLP